MKKLSLAILLAVAAFGALADNPHGLPPGIAKKLSACHDCGTVQAVRHEKRKGDGGAVGIVGGAVVGGLLGNQIGKGTGNTVATVGGVVAGGFAGNEIQKRVTAKEVWVTEVKMKDGRIRRFEHDKQPGWKQGGVVRITGDSLQVY